MGQLQLTGLFRRFFKEIAFRAKPYLQRSDYLFAYRVQRRVGYLGKQLLEVVEQQLRPVRKHS